MGFLVGRDGEMIDARSFADLADEERQKRYRDTPGPPEKHWPSWVKEHYDKVWIDGDRSVR